MTAVPGEPALSVVVLVRDEGDIPVLVHAKDFKVVEIPVAHRPRVHGRSKYRWERFMRGALDLATVIFLSVYRRRPLHLFGLLGWRS